MTSRRVFCGVIASGASRQPVQNMFGNAEAYEQFMGRWSRLLVPGLVEFGRIPRDGRVLDVGAGTGMLALGMAARGERLQVDGIDVSEEYVAYARKRNPLGGRVRFELGDAMKLRFGDRVFDACSSLLVFNFIPDPALALRELKRVTRAGGVISAAVWDYGGGMTMLRTYWDAVVSLDPGAEPRDEKHMPLCRQGELAELWRRERLQAVEQRALDVTMRFESFADYWDPFLLGQGPAGAYARSLDDRRRQVLRDEVRRRLGQGAQAGEFQLKARAWAVRGTNGPTI